MTHQLEILRAYQSWRRGEDERTMEESGLSPQTIGAAIYWAIAELEKPRQAVPDGWQPIETAPKDGTEILAWREGAGWFMARWISPMNFATESEIEELDPETVEQEDWFCADFCAGHRLEGSEVPTLWMPLPQPPGGGEG